MAQTAYQVLDATVPVSRALAPVVPVLKVRLIVFGVYVPVVLPMAICVAVTVTAVLDVAWIFNPLDRPGGMPPRGDAAQVAPVLASPLPIVPGATVCTVEMPLPSMTELAVIVDRPVPPLAAPRGVVKLTMLPLVMEPP